jgi:hypothetical protein
MRIIKGSIVICNLDIFYEFRKGREKKVDLGIGLVKSLSPHASSQIYLILL